LAFIGFAGLLSAEAIPSGEESERLTAVLIEGHDLGDCGPCHRTPRVIPRRRATNVKGEWGERIVASGLSLSRIAAETGLKCDRVRRIRNGSPPRPGEIQVLEALLGREDRDAEHER
jgi:hypothetical protein